MGAAVEHGGACHSASSPRADPGAGGFSFPPAPGGPMTRRGNGPGRGGPAKGPGTGGEASGIPARGTWPSFTEGNGAALTHGAHSSRVIAPVAAELEQALEEMVVGTPAGAPAFAAARGALALKLARLAKVREHLDTQHDGSPLDAAGDPLAAARLEAELVRSIERSLGDLGLTPASAAKLGVNLAQSESMVQRIQREAREGDGAMA